MICLTTEMTPKIDDGGVAFSLRSRDHKDPQIVCLNDQGGGVMEVTHDKTATLRAEAHGHEPIMVEMTSTKNTVVENGISPTLTARMGTGGGQVNAVVKENSSWDGSQTAGTLGVKSADQRMPDKGHFDGVISYGLDRAAYNQGMNAQYNISIEEEKIGAQVAKGPGAVCDPTPIVRRLTPLECERLQGFPDGWTDIGDWVDSNGKTHKGESDSPRYKALGNSIALPFWEWMAKRMVEVLKADGVEHPTMASLFDGIGGFPLAYSRAGCDPVWASEIEEFPIAVTKIHFLEDDT